MATGRVDLDGNSINPITICMIGAGGFIGSHLSEKLMAETPHKVLAVNVYNDKIKNLLQSSAAGAPLSWADRIQFHRLNIKNDSRLEGLIKMADLTINLAALFTPADHNTRHLDTIYSNFVDALPGDPAYYVLTEDASPCIFGPIEKQRWSYACAKQLIEKLIYAEVAENGREFTIVRPFNWIGPRMDFIPGIDGPGEGVLRVLACFSNNFFRHQPLKLVDGGQSLSTFVHIKDAIEAVLLMIENPAEASGHIFHLGNPNNEVTVRQLAEMMTQVYTKVSGELAIDAPTIEISSKEFYGEGYDDSDKRIPDMTIINQQLGWDPKTYLLESTLTNQHQTYSEAINKATYKVLALDVYNDKMHLLEPSTSGAALPWADHIQFNRLNIKNDSRLEGLIKMANLTINLAAICTPADYNTPRDTIYINFTDAFSMVRREEVKECADSKKGNSNLATFPRDAVECILSNLPAEALLRSRLISKDWNELIEESFLTNREVRSPSYRLIIGNSTRSTSISLCLMHELGVQERYWTPVPTSTDILMASGIEIPVSSSDGVVLITDHPYQPVP